MTEEEIKDIKKYVELREYVKSERKSLLSFEKTYKMPFMANGGASTALLTFFQNSTSGIMFKLSGVLCFTLGCIFVIFASRHKGICDSHINKIEMLFKLLYKILKKGKNPLKSKQDDTKAKDESIEHNVKDEIENIIKNIEQEKKK